jgi:hypothetical protein
MASSKTGEVTSTATRTCALFIARPRAETADDDARLLPRRIEPTAH